MSLPRRRTAGSIPVGSQRAVRLPQITAADDLLRTEPNQVDCSELSAELPCVVGLGAKTSASIRLYYSAPDRVASYPVNNIYTLGNRYE